MKKITKDNLFGVLADERTIKVKYFDKDMPCIERIAGGDWIDLRAREEIVLGANEFALIPLGVAMELPYGYEALVVPRSSLFKRYGVIQTNSIGIIDNSYCGDNDEWMLPVYATRATCIPRYERICQFRILRSQPRFEIETVRRLGNPDRHGFGSTGRC